MPNIFGQNPHLEVEGKVKVTDMDTVTNATENVVRQGDGTLAVTAIGTPIYAIGDFAQGGVVFWVNASGHHGKVVSIYEIGAVPWSNLNTTEIGASAQSDVNGAGNTVAITMQSGHESSAARHCADLAYGGYDDWYLPTIDEFDLIHDNRNEINTAAIANGGEALSSSSYWSSTEEAASLAWVKSFANGGRFTVIKSNSVAVRAIRAF